VHAIALKMGKQELAKVSGPHIGGEAKREASVQRGRLIERMAFLDCAMAPYRPLPSSDATECAGLAQKLKAETTTGTAAAAQNPSKESPALSPQRRQLLLSGLSHESAVNGWAQNTSDATELPERTHNHNAALLELLDATAPLEAFGLFNKSLNGLSVEQQQHRQQQRRQLLLASSSKLKGAAAVAAGLGGGPPAPTPASLAKEAAVSNCMLRLFLAFIFQEIRVLAYCVTLYHYVLFFNGNRAFENASVNTVVIRFIELLHHDASAMWMHVWMLFLF